MAEEARGTEMNPWDELRKRIDFIPKIGLRALVRSYKFDVFHRMMREEKLPGIHPKFKDVVEEIAGCSMTPEQWDKLKAETGEIVSQMDLEIRDQEFELMQKTPPETASNIESRGTFTNLLPRKAPPIERDALPIHMPFLKEFEEGLRLGVIRASARTEKYGDVGDRFTAYGVMFVLDGLLHCELEIVATEYYRLCGCRSPEVYRETWRRLHPRAGWRGNQKVWLHIFHKEEWS